MPHKKAKATNKSKQQKKGCIEIKQKLMIESLRKCKGLVTYACEAAGICRYTHYDWLKKYPDYVQAVDEIDNFVLDKIEESSLRMIEEGKTPAMNIFYLKTKGKRRGFIEKQEIEHSTGDLTSLRNVIKDCDNDGEHQKDY